MAIITAQQLTHYYDYYRTTEIKFTKDVIKIFGMDPRQIYLKCDGTQWPCIINSTSFQQVKVIIGTKGGAFQQLSKKDAGAVNVRFYFIRPSGEQLSFFIAGRVNGISSYANSTDLAILNIAFTQRPPDAFIEMVGHLIDANENAIRRYDERIILNQDTCRRLGIPKEETVITIQGVPRRCILRDLSFGGAKVMVLGLAKFLVNKTIELSLQFTEPEETITLKGTILKAIPAEGRNDIYAASIRFDEDSISMAYKIHINNYLSSLRKNELENQARQEEMEKQKALEEQKIKEQRALKIQQNLKAAQPNKDD
ncbi:MAG: PilZ domain-containing protein [Treponema sp.]|nr:PilZ domain-containing protein [Treponema sp.]MBQ4236031.1 PilZ domain-containing protein [Treponema sp.]